MKIIKTKPYLKATKKLSIGAQDEQRLFGELAETPEKGALIVGGGGIRKIRLALGNRGKSAGARVIYCAFVSAEIIFLLAAYAKGEKENLTRREINDFREITDQIRKALENERDI